jgi:hypothetical protein
MQLQIGGIYSKEVWQRLKQEGVEHFGFSFLPTSFNFLQQHQFLALAQELFVRDHFYYFYFQQERDFVIQKQIDDCQQLLDQNFGGGDFANHFQLVFSEHEDISFADSFSMGYWLPFNFEQDIGFYRSARFLKGITLDYRSLEYLHQKDLWDDFLTLYRQQLLPLLQERRIKLALSIDWDSDIFPSLLDSISFDYLQLEINSKVESSYRQVDLERITKLLKFYKSEWL